LRRAAVFCLAFMVELAASCWLPTARADDRALDPQAAAELATRKRILANWQARQDRIKSFYVAWKPGPNERPAWLSIDGLAGVHQLWMASDGRFREEFPSFTFGRSRIFEHRVDACDGKSLRELRAPLAMPNAEAALGDPSSRRHAFGRIQALKDLKRSQFFPGGVELLAFRPLQSPWADWTLKNSRVTSQNAVVGRQHFVKIQKTDAQSGITEACWVDPRRDDLVIHFSREFLSGSEDWSSLEYKQDPRYGWVPTGWQSESRDINDLGMRRGARGTTGEAIVTEYRINGDFSPETFQIKYPAGTILVDSAAKRQYFVRRDGSWRGIDLSQLGKSIKYEQLVNEDSTRAAKP
jgi:hypothetical protein